MSVVNRVEIIMGSRSDWATMKLACKPLQDMEIEFGKHIVSAHRTPERLYEFARSAHERGVQVIIAGAGGAAHLPGMTAALTHLPVIAVPVESKSLNGMDSLLSIVQMPKGVAVATQAIGEPGAFNAGLMAAQIVALSDSKVAERLVAWRKNQTLQVAAEVEAL